MTGERELVRMERIGMAVAVAGTIVTWILRDSRWAVGFLAGGVLSILSFHTLRRLVEGLTPGTKIQVRGSALFFVFRYLIFGAAAYVIVKLLGISVTPFLEGLFVSPAAVMMEILYELVAPKPKL